MNTIEKRKLESVVVAKLNEARQSFKARREREHEELVAKFESNPPKPVHDIVVQFTKLCADMEKKKQELEDKIQSHGYTIERDYTGRYHNTRVLTYKEPTLTAHSKETAERMQKIDDLQNEYILSIYAETDDVTDIFDAFANDLAKLTG